MITSNQSTGAVLNPAQVEITENSAQLQTKCKQWKPQLHAMLAIAGDEELWDWIYKNLDLANVM